MFLILNSDNRVVGRTTAETPYPLGDLDYSDVFGKVFNPETGVYTSDAITIEMNTPPEPTEPPTPVPTEPPVPAPVVRPKVSPIEFKLLFTSQERLAIKASADPVVQDFFEIVNDLRLTAVDLNLQSTQSALDYLVSVELLTEARKDVILTGVIQ